MIHSSGNVGGERTSGRYEHGATSVTCSGVYCIKGNVEKIVIGLIVACSCSSWGIAVAVISAS